ncbi:unannotated protein [freshwater metagenome]|uniref:Unannotated protein n=1 Tax=freshwater metagenome TaxID=449393 RepID=A0A6J7MVD1_9ZZZZ
MTPTKPPAETAADAGTTVVVRTPAVADATRSIDASGAVRRVRKGRRDIKTSSFSEWAMIHIREFLPRNALRPTG